MAKQSGIHQLRGKIGGNVYYSQKGVAGGLVRKINEGMSERVKNDAAFANTRLNAAEFGAAGNFSGTAMRVLSQRWRTILVPFAVGKFAKDVLANIKTDASNPWGQRYSNFAAGGNAIRGVFNSYAKNNYAESFATDITYSGNVGDGVNITGSTTAETSQNLKSRGANGVVYEFYAYDAQFGGFSTNSGKYSPSEGKCKFIGRVDAVIGQVTDLATTSQTINVQETDIDILAGLLVVALPYKVVGNVKYTLQEMCSFTLI